MYGARILKSTDSHFTHSSNTEHSCFYLVSTDFSFSFQRFSFFCLFHWILGSRTALSMNYNLCLCVRVLAFFPARSLIVYLALTFWVYFFLRSLFCSILLDFSLPIQRKISTTKQMMLDPMMKHTKIVRVQISTFLMAERWWWVDVLFISNAISLSHLFSSYTNIEEYSDCHCSSAPCASSQKYADTTNRT